MEKQQYIQIRNATPIDEISYGYRTVTLFSESELNEEQLGYSVNSITGETDDEWKESWLVIGREDLLGDPLFTDLQIEELPVYTAAHGESEWNPVLIASSFKGFIESLLEVWRVSNGRSYPAELERNPLPDEERKHVLNRIVELNGNASLEFWESWFEA
jgi:hypothetical protein